MKTERTSGLARSWSLLWALWAVLSAQPAVAAAVVSCDEDPACRPVVSRAREFSKAGQLDDALLSYQAAYRITPDPRILFNIGRIQQKQNKLTDAADSYQKFLDTNFDDEALRNKAQEYLAQVKAVAAAAPETPAPAQGVELGGDVSSPGKPGSNDPGSGTAKAPVYKKAWFWVVIGTVIAGGIAGGVAAGVIAKQQPPAAPDGVPTFRLFMP